VRVNINSVEGLGLGFRIKWRDYYALKVLGDLIGGFVLNV
jgi:hypothetical protein